MSGEPIIYSFVARGTRILAEYTEFTGNFPAIAAQCLQRLPSSNNKFTYNCDHHTFNFLVEDGYAYCVVAKDSVGKQISIAFLKRMKADFKKRYGGGKADQLWPKVSIRSFGRPIMKEHMKYIIEHAEEIEKLLKVKAQVSEVKKYNVGEYRQRFYCSVSGIRILFLQLFSRHDCNGAMVDQVIENRAAIDKGENLTNLADKTETLRDQAQDYNKQGKKIRRRKMWYQNMKIKMVVFGILLLLVLIIWFCVCHGFDCTN